MKAMNEVFQGYIDKFVILYLYDILIYSSSRTEHITHLQQVMKRLQQYNLKANLKKCEFFKSEIQFLGHM